MRHGKALRVLAVGLLFSVTLWHRSANLASIPPPHACDDEYSYVWVGLTLMDSGQPVSWSMLPNSHRLGYGLLGGNNYYFVRPAVDHPPAFSLLAAAFAKLTDLSPMTIRLHPSGTLNLWEINLGQARVLTLIFYAMSFFLLFDIAFLSLGYGAALTALCIYGFSKPMVIHHRMLVADNFTTVLLLANIAVLQRYLTGLCSKAAITVVTISLVPLAAMAKIVAVSQAAAVAAVLIAHNKKRLLWMPIAGTGLAMAAIAMYGLYVGWDSFLTTQTSQMNRFTGFNLLERLAGTHMLVGHAEFSFVILIGWLCLFGMVFRKRSMIPALVPVTYLAAFTFFSSTEKFYGWHNLPFYPFLCLAIAFAWRQAWRAGGGMPCFVVFCLAAMWLFHGLFTISPAHGKLLRWGFLVTIAIAAFSLSPSTAVVKTSLVRPALLFLLVCALGTEYYAANHMTIRNWPELILATTADQENLPPPLEWLPSSK